MKRRRSTPDDERILRDASADPVDRAIALNALAVDHFVHLEREIVPLLDDPAFELRDEAIMALVYYFKLDAHVPRALSLLTSDASEYVRGSAALAVGNYALRTGRRRDEIIRALVQVLERETEGLVAGKAYDQVRELVPTACPTSREDLLSPDEVRAMVKWSELGPYRAH